jgi:C4-dicarboxylate transporter, DctM subunit
VNVASCAVFAAVSGSSAATCATIGRIALPELSRRGYDERMTIGTLAGSSTLGLLIPPSIIMIVYATATEQSIARLFIAGVVPGVMLAVMFMGFHRRVGDRQQAPHAAARPVDLALEPDRVAQAADPGAAADPRRDRLDLWRARVGDGGGGGRRVPVARVVVVFRHAHACELPRCAARRTRTSCMIAFILAGAAFLTAAMGYTGIPRALAEWIGTLGLSQWQLLFALTLFFIAMGCFLDGISMVVLTAAVIMPLVVAAGFDLIWFGIYLVLVVEMAQITPPVGFNLFVLQGLTGRSIFAIGLYALPLFLLMCVAVVLIAAFPEIALWLPSTMLDRSAGL